MKAKDLKYGDLIWAFEIRGCLYKDDEPILNCYYVKQTCKEHENQLEVTRYESLFDPDDWGWLIFPKNYDLCKPIIVYYGRNCIWCYGTDGKAMSELFEKRLMNNLNLKNRLLYDPDEDKFRFIEDFND